jgi:hypothetical protein
MAFMPQQAPLVVLTFVGASLLLAVAWLLLAWAWLARKMELAQRPAASLASRPHPRHGLATETERHKETERGNKRDRV